jgi:hypothetical protein
VEDIVEDPAQNQSEGNGLLPVLLQGTLDLPEERILFTRTVRSIHLQYPSHACALR